jgi:vitamin B12 transporter
MFRFSGASALALIALPFSLSTTQAQTIALPDVVISANQTPQPADRVGASVTVLQGDEIRRRGIETVADALRTVPGVHVNNANGNKGGLTQVRMRGSGASQIQVLIDDVPVGRLDGGDFDFADFLVDDIDRIEVVRGPQSGIYGGNAQAGVIAIYTVTGRGLKKPVLTTRSEIGTQNSSLLSATMRGANGPFYGAFSAQHRETNGYNISRSGTEKDGHRAFIANSKIGVDISEYVNVEAVMRHTDRKVQYDPETTIPLPDAFGRDTQQNSHARVNLTARLWDGNFVQRLGYYVRQEDLTSECPTCFQAFRATGTTGSGADYKGVFNYNLGSVQNTSTFLLDWKNDSFQSGGVTAERDRTGLAFEHIVSFATGLTLSGAVRHDFHDVFQDFTSWRIAGSQKFSTGTRLHSSVGTGITLPTFFQQFGFNLTFVGNPNLKPETSTGWDFGVEQTFFGGLLVTDATYFSIEADNAIVGFGNTAINNAGFSTRRGVELTAKYNPVPWLTLEGTYTYTDAETPAGIDEIRRPKHSASAAAIFRFPDNKTQASVIVAHNGKMFDDAFLPFPAPLTRFTLTDYTLVNAIVTYQATPTTQFYIRGENLLNERYEEVYSYRANGATGYIGMRMKLGELAPQINY